MNGHERLREPETAPLEPLLSVSEVRRILRISESGVYRLVRSGELSTVRIGGRTLFAPQSVRELIASRSRPPTGVPVALEDQR